MLNALVELMIRMPGAIGAAIVDIETGQSIARAGDIAPELLETVGVANARYVRCQAKFAQNTDLQKVEDIMIVLTDHYHLIRVVQRADNYPRLFFYLVLNRAESSIAWSRLQLVAIENRMDTDLRLLDIECDYVLDSYSIRTKIERIISMHDYGTLGVNDPDEDVPAFMRTDVALRLLGINMNTKSIFNSAESLP